MKVSQMSVQSTRYPCALKHSMEQRNVILKVSFKKISMYEIYSTNFSRELKICTPPSSIEAFFNYFIQIVNSIFLLY